MQQSSNVFRKSCALNAGYSRMKNQKQLLVDALVPLTASISKYFYTILKYFARSFDGMSITARVPSRFFVVKRY